jgi:dihydrofolate synthase/folylpolyglutamate synthase
VDIAVFETDLGAATDSTGVITPIVSLLTNITPDHLHLFNNDFLKYAEEKVGVIKPNIPIYVGETPTDENVKNILFNKVKECNSKLILTDLAENNLIYEQYGLGSYDSKFGKFTTSLSGDYQKHNINLVLNVINELRLQGYNISDENVILGLQNLYKNTKLCGRWQILNKEPRIILDCGHNINAWEKIINQLKKMEYKHLYVISQMCHDKDIDGITKLLLDKENITYIFPSSPIKRLIEPRKLIYKTKWMKKSKRYTAKSIVSTLNKLSNNVVKDDVILICGTCKNIHQVIQCINDIKKDKPTFL